MKTSTHCKFSAFTAGAAATSGACRTTASTPAQRPAQKRCRTEGRRWCWAPARSRWWRRRWPRCVAPTSWCTRLAPATRSCASSRAWPTSTCSRRAAPLSGTPAPPTPCCVPSEGAWPTWPSPCRTARQNWPTTSLARSAKGRTGGPTTAGCWLIETQLGSTPSSELWEANFNLQHLTSLHCCLCDLGRVGGW